MGKIKDKNQWNKVKTDWSVNKSTNRQLFLAEPCLKKEPVYFGRKKANLKTEPENSPMVSASYFFLPIAFKCDRG